MWCQSGGWLYLNYEASVFKVISVRQNIRDQITVKSRSNIVRLAQLLGRGQQE